MNQRLLFILLRQQNINTNYFAIYTMKKSFYDVLGINKNASETEIKKAYRTLSLKYHPDRNPSEEARTLFPSINEAYETLGDKAKKQQYDMELNGFGGGEMDDIQNIFNMMFGGQSRVPGFGGGAGFPGVHVFHGPPGGGHPFQHMFQTMQKPPPIIKNVQISLEQAYVGCSLPIEIERWTLENEVKTHELETIYVPIHPGIDDNEIIIFREKGHIASDTLKGDVKIIIRIENSTQFKRHGLDLVYVAKLTLREALCGFAFELKHLNGKVMNITNYSNKTIISPSAKKIIPNLGMTREKQTGNLILEFDITFPASITPEQCEALEKILP